MENTNDKIMPEGFEKKIVGTATYTGNKNIRRNKMSFKAKLKMAVVCLIVLLLVFYWVVYAVNKFFNENELKFQSPVQKPVWIEKRVPPTIHQVVPEAEAKELPKRYADEIDQYIYEKFGRDGDLAVRISRGENGSGQCDRINVNKNGSIDVGRFQINSLHFKRVPLSKLVDCKANVDFAHQLYTEQKGFGAWVVYNTGSYKLVDLKNYLN